MLYMSVACHSRSPGLLTKINLSVVGCPTRGIFVCGIDVFKRDGEMDEIQVKVVQAPVGKLLLCECIDLGMGVSTILALGEEYYSHALSHGSCSRATV